MLLSSALDIAGEIINYVVMIFNHGAAMSS